MCYYLHTLERLKQSPRCGIFTIFLQYSQERAKVGISSLQDNCSCTIHLIDSNWSVPALNYNSNGKIGGKNVSQRFSGAKPRLAETKEKNSGRSRRQEQKENYFSFLEALSQPQVPFQPMKSIHNSLKVITGHFKYTQLNTS